MQSDAAGDRWFRAGRQHSLLGGKGSLPLVHYHVTNYSQNIVTHNNVHGSGIQTASLGSSGSRFLRQLHSGCQQRLKPWLWPGDLLLRWFSRKAVSRRAQFPSHRPLLWLLECPYNMAANPPPPQRTQSKTAKRESTKEVIVPSSILYSSPYSYLILSLFFILLLILYGIFLIFIFLFGCLGS